jgi:hypothetical protein
MFDYSDFRNKLTENLSRKFFPDIFTVKILACADPGFLGGLKLAQFLGPSLRKRTQNYKFKTKHESEYLFIMTNQNK